MQWKPGRSVTNRSILMRRRGWRKRPSIQSRKTWKNRPQSSRMRIRRLPTSWSLLWKSSLTPRRDIRVIMLHNHMRIPFILFRLCLGRSAFCGHKFHCIFIVFVTGYSIKLIGYSSYLIYMVNLPAPGNQIPSIRRIGNIWNDLESLLRFAQTSCGFQKPHDEKH